MQSLLKQAFLLLTHWKTLLKCEILSSFNYRSLETHSLSTPAPPALPSSQLDESVEAEQLLFRN